MRFVVEARHRDHVHRRRDKADDRGRTPALRQEQQMADSASRGLHAPLQQVGVVCVTEPDPVPGCRRGGAEARNATMDAATGQVRQRQALTILPTSTNAVTGAASSSGTNASADCFVLRKATDAGAAVSAASQIMTPCNAFWVSRLRAEPVAAAGLGAEGEAGPAGVESPYPRPVGGRGFHGASGPGIGQSALAAPRAVDLHIADFPRRRAHRADTETALVIQRTSQPSACSTTVTAGVDPTMLNPAGPP